MKNIVKYILVINLFALWTYSNADEKITNGSKVKIKPGTHFIEKGAIVVDANSNLLIEGMITIEGNLSNNNGFSGIQIKSYAENTGSLIFNNGNPIAKVERYMTSRVNHYIGSPVIGEIAEALDFGNNPTTSLYSYTDGNGLSQLNYTDELISSQGYYYRIGSSNNNGITPQFEGNLRSSDLVLDNSSSPPLLYNSRGFNMIANPYSCAIDWDDENIEFNNMEASVWVYDSKFRKFKFRNNSGYGNLKDGIIPMAQGFYVRARNANASLIIPKEARRHETQAYYKGSEEVNSQLSFVKIEIEKDTLTDELWMGYQWNSSDEFDNGIDISKMFTFEDEPQIYAKHNDLELCVDIFSEFQDEPKTIPIYFKPGTLGVHRINILNWQGFEGVDVFLEDTFNDEMQDVKDIDFYEFSAEPGDSEDRFLLHLNPEGTVSTNDLPNQAIVHMHAYRNAIYINSDGYFANQNKNVLIYDVNGKQLGEVYLPAGKLQKIENVYQRKILILKAIYPQETFTQKILNF